MLLFNLDIQSLSHDHDIICTLRTPNRFACPIVCAQCPRLVKFDVPSSAIPFHNGRHASSCVREAVAKETVWSTKAPSLSSPSPLLANIWRPLPFYGKLGLKIRSYANAVDTARESEGGWRTLPICHGNPALV